LKRQEELLAFQKDQAKQGEQKIKLLLALVSQLVKKD
jgi:hypothetical protein